MNSQIPTTTPANEQYPVFVYGTLRPGGHNYGTFLDGRVSESAKVTLNGLEMFGSPNDGFPYVALGEGKVVGELLNIKSEVYDNTVFELDFLEGFYEAGDAQNHYERKLIEITNEDGETARFWIYVVDGEMEKHVRESRERLENGDWLAAVKNAPRNPAHYGKR